MYLKELNIDELEKQFSFSQFQPGNAILVLIAENDLFFANEIIEYFNSLDLPVLGGIFPGVIYEGRMYKKGAIITTLSVVKGPWLCDDLQKATEVHTVLGSIESGMNNTAFILYDAFTGSIKHFLSEIFLRYGTSLTYIGGGAGTSDYVQKPTVFTNKGIYQDAAVIAVLQGSMSVSARHGWEVFKGPYLVTDSRKNIIKSINWQNAFEVYKAALKEEGIQIDEQSVYEAGWRYPLGVYRQDQEFILRSPIHLNKNRELVTIGEVPDNSAVYVLKTDKKSLLEASDKAVAEVNQSDFISGFVFYAIDYARKVILKDAFHHELLNAHNHINEKHPVAENFGALTIGEIASYSSGSIELFNKSFVIGAINERE